MYKKLVKIGENAKNAFKDNIDTKLKNKVLNDYWKLVSVYKNKIILENKKDVKLAQKKNLKENLVKRLSLDNNKINQIINSIKSLVKLKDPTNLIIETW